MNKMAKGALSIGVGAALLLGGGGTLAVWNQTAESSAGQIAAGDLGLTAETGIWTNSANQKVDLATYRIVPGEVLTYTQDLNVTLVGDRIQAKLTLNTDELDPKLGEFVLADLNYTKPALKTMTGAAVPEILTPAIVTELGGKVQASASITFDNTTDLSSAGAVASFGKLKYELEQEVGLTTPAPIAPVTPAPTAPATGK